MTKNITLRMDEELLRRAKHVAVEEDKSLSAWIADLIQSIVKNGSESSALSVNEESVAYKTSRKTPDRAQLLDSLNRMAMERHMTLSAWVSQLALEAAQWEASEEQRMMSAWSVMNKTFRLGGAKFDRDSCYDRIS